MFRNVEGETLPEFTAKDLTGKIYTTKSLQDAKATFINLWFASCPPCIAEVPNLNRLYDTMENIKGFQFFAITWEPEIEVKKAIIKYNIHFPVLIASKEIVDQLTFGRGYPTNMVLNKEGKVSCILSSGSLNPSSELERYFIKEIERLLTKQN